MMCVLCLAGTSILAYGGGGIFTTTSTIITSSIIRNASRCPTQTKINDVSYNKKH